MAVQWTVGTRSRSRAPLWRVVLLVGGLFLFAVALVLGLQSGLGAYSWVVFHEGIARHTDLTVGQATIVVSAVIVAVSWSLGVRPGVGTVANLVLVGAFMDAVLWSESVPRAPSLPLAVLELAASVVLLGVATGMYIAAGYGAGPRDSLMLAVARRFGWSVGWVRWLLEVTITVVGIALGGSFGVGTIVVALTVGPAVRVGFRLFGLDRLGFPRSEGG